MKETYKKVKGFEKSYEVSNLGNVRSIDRYVRNQYGIVFRKGVQIKPHIDKDGYLRVNLCKNNISRTTRVHILVAKAFLKNPEEKLIVNHKNSIRTDNRSKNLEWVTSSENNFHTYLFGGKSKKYSKTLV